MIGAPRYPYAEELAVALELAREAGRRARRAQEGPLAVERKADRSVVTAIDRELNAFLVDRLAARFPDDAVLGEESADDPVARLSRPRLWLVDPIDGTANYAAR
ncbi:MAG TPA: inositol monophosphatase family protein, partial [Thermodesulfobacteriota bacterium]|nr:inositol monophosphatase family protein [Thermodesulfobacteriota bacterium]